MDTSSVPSDASVQPPDGSEYAKMIVNDMSLWYGDSRALNRVNMTVQEHKITSLIGPSGCGKSTLLRCLNRMNDLIEGVSIEGQVLLDGIDLYQDLDPVLVRRRVGMVFQSPNPFPKSIYKNIVWGAHINGIKTDMDTLVERVLRSAALWEEVKDRLHSHAYSLSGGQQQRLCIARALAIEPEVLLMDEPTSALDPIASAKVEETIQELAKNYTIVIVTHNMQQAQRISDTTCFFYEGDMLEMNSTKELFGAPQHQKTADYLRGRFG